VSVDGYPNHRVLLGLPAHLDLYAQLAYEAHAAASAEAHAVATDPFAETRGTAVVPAWHNLSRVEQACWIRAVEVVEAILATRHAAIVVAAFERKAVDPVQEYVSCCGAPFTGTETVHFSSCPR